MLLSAVPDKTEAQEGGVSILQKGPIFKKGLPFFLPNAIPSFYGLYTFKDIQVSVYYTETRIVRKPEWNPLPCTVSDGLVVRNEPDTLLIFPAEYADWTVFISFPAAREDMCEFADRFLDRFQYFRGITRDRSIPPFPAVIPLN